jgi:hypothetical protein
VGILGSDHAPLINDLGVIRGSDFRKQIRLPHGIHTAAEYTFSKKRTGLGPHPELGVNRKKGRKIKQSKKAMSGDLDSADEASFYPATGTARHSGPATARDGEMVPGIWTRGEVSFCVGSLGVRNQRVYEQN